MPIIFITRDIEFCEKITSAGYEAQNILIEKYVPKRKTYYISPANSLCFMDGGIDYSLSRNIMPGIESSVKQLLNIYGKTNLIGRKYLPIGSSLIIDYDEVRSLIVAPTMLLPQNVSNTHNVYYSTMAIMYNLILNRGEDISNTDIIFTSLCCGYGKMTPQESVNQIIAGLRDFSKYKPEYIDRNNGVLICEPNLLQQPKFYQNTEWFNIDANEIIQV